MTTKASLASDRFSLVAIGKVHRVEDQTVIAIDKAYQDALLGLDGFSHILVCYWFHRNDSAEKRAILRVHPRGNSANPLTGVFATHSPVRPNLIGITVCRLLAIEDGNVFVEGLDALDGTPVVDVKCFIPEKRSSAEYRLPEWV